MNMSKVVYGPILDWSCDGLGDIFSRAMNQKSDFYPYNVSVVSNPENDKPIKYVIEVALAGIAKEFIDIHLNDDGQLVIVVTPCIGVEKGTKLLRNGISRSKRSITFDIPKEINIKEITSSYVDGLLTINLPLVVEKSKSRSIKIG